MYNIVIQYIHTLQNDHQKKLLSPSTIIISSSLLKVGTICCCFPKLCPTLYKSTVCSLSGSSAHGILQARILEWVVISSSRGASQLRDRTQSPALAGRFITIESPGKPHLSDCCFLFHFSKSVPSHTPEV